MIPESEGEYAEGCWFGVTVMSVVTIFVGYIEEAWPGSSGDYQLQARKTAVEEEICRHNERVIDGLPVEDAFPALCRGMFGMDREKSAGISFRNRPIHFAASMKNADFCIRDWLDKFEGLLREMYWESAYVRIKGGYLGAYEFQWKPEREWVEEMCKRELRKITAWEFKSSMEEKRLKSMREKDTLSRGVVVRENEGGGLKGNW
jgi:hypothetical protein